MDLEIASPKQSIDNGGQKISPSPEMR